MATADWTPLTVVPRSWTTAEMDTFMNDVSMTNTNIAAAKRIPARAVGVAGAGVGGVSSVIARPYQWPFGSFQDWLSGSSTVSMRFWT
jgi:hypothetical protein